MATATTDRRQPAKDISNRFEWAVAVLQRLKIQPNKENVAALIGWSKIEGGHDNGALYNYLNTTQPEPGAGNTGTQGNIKIYKDWNQGIDATVKTLTNGLYNPIIHALNTGTKDDVANAITASKWGTKGPAVKQTIDGVDLYAEIAHNGDKGASLTDMFNAGADTIGIGGALHDAGAALMSVPTFLTDLWGKIGSGEFWLSVGKILLGVIALIMGIRFIAKEWSIPGV